MPRQLNQTSSPKSDRKWKAKVTKTNSKTLFNRIDKAVKEAKYSIKSKGFKADLLEAIFNINKLEYKLHHYGSLSIKEWKELHLLRGDVFLANTWQDLYELVNIEVDTKKELEGVKI